jgi:hypothetical protein
MLELLHALDIESDDVANYCFPKDWPPDGRCAPALSATGCIWPDEHMTARAQTSPVQCLEIRSIQKADHKQRLRPRNAFISAKSLILLLINSHLVTVRLLFGAGHGRQAAGYASCGALWLTGTAVSARHHCHGFARFPLPEDSAIRYVFLA